MKFNKEKFQEWKYRARYGLVAIALIATVATLSKDAMAGLPPTTLSGLLDSIKQTVFNYIVPNHQKTSLGGVNALIETGNYNVLSNPSFEGKGSTNANYAGWTVDTTNTTGSGTPVTSGTQDGLQALGLTFNSGSYSTTLLSQTYTATPQTWDGVNIEATMWIKVPLDANFSGYVTQFCLDVNSVNVQCITVRDTGTTWTQYTINWPGNTSANIPYKIYVKTTASSGAGILMDFDNAYLGPSRNIGTAVPTNVFTAQISSTAVVTNQNYAGWISSASVASGAFTLQFPPALFNNTPHCSFTSDAGNFAGTATTATNTSLVYNAALNSGGSGVAVNHTITCIKTGSDFVQPATQANAINFVNTFTASVSSTGVVTNQNYPFLNGNFTVTGTSTYTGAFNSTVFGVTPNCVAIPASGGSNLVIGGGATSTTALAFTIQTGNTGASTAAAWTLSCTRAGTDAKPNVAVPVLNGSVTSNAGAALRIESFNFNSSSTVGTACTTSTCTISNPTTSGLFSVSRGSTGVYTVSYPTGTFAAIPQCFFKPIISGAAGYCDSSGTPTTIAFSVTCATAGSGGTLTDASVDIMCIGFR